MFNMPPHRRALLIAIIFSVLTLGTYLIGGRSFDAWFKITNTAHESSFTTGSSFLLLFALITIVAWINFFIKYRKR